MRNSLYSVSIEEALKQVEGKKTYQKRLLSASLGIWTIWWCFGCYLKQLLASSLIPTDLSESVILLYSVGLLIGSVMFALLAGNIGRKPSTFVPGLLGGILFLCSSLSRYDEALLIYCSFLGLMSGGSIISSFLLLLEVVQVELRGKYSCLLFSSAGVGMLLASVFYDYFSSWQSVFAVLGILLWVFAFWILKFSESPRYLGAVKGKYSMTRKTLNAISASNGTSAFGEILEGEKVVGTQELISDPSQMMSEHEGKHSFVQITDTVISVTTSELSSVKQYSLFEVCMLKKRRRHIITFMSIGSSLSLCIGLVEYSAPIYDNWNRYIVGMFLAGVMWPIFKFLNKTNRQLTLMVLLGASCISSLIGVVLEIKKCEDGMICEVIYFCSLLTMNACLGSLVGAICVLYLMAAEMMQSTIRSIGFVYIELGVKLGVVLSLFLQAAVPLHFLLICLIVVFTLFVCCVSACNLNEESEFAMEDYMDEDRKEINRAHEISNMNVSSFQPAPPQLSFEEGISEVR